MHYEETVVIADSRAGKQAALEISPRCQQGDVARDRGGWASGAITGVVRQIGCDELCDKTVRSVLPTYPVLLPTARR